MDMVKVALPAFEFLDDILDLLGVAFFADEQSIGRVYNDQVVDADQ